MVGVGGVPGEKEDFDEVRGGRVGCGAEEGGTGTPRQGSASPQLHLLQGRDADQRKRRPHQEG